MVSGEETSGSQLEEGNSNKPCIPVRRAISTTAIRDNRPPVPARPDRRLERTATEPSASNRTPPIVPPRPDRPLSREASRNKLVNKPKIPQRSGVPQMNSPKEPQTTEDNLPKPKNCFSKPPPPNPRKLIPGASPNRIPTSINDTPSTTPESSVTPPESSVTRPASSSYSPESIESLDENSKVVAAEEHFNRRKKEFREKTIRELMQFEKDVTDDGTDYGDAVFNVPNIPRVIEFYGNEHYYQIKNATIYKLVERVTSLVPEFIEEYNEFLKIFFMTYRSFCSPQQVLNLIIRRFEGYENIEADSERWPIKFNVIRQGVCYAIVHWFDNHYRDFTDTTLRNTLTNFIAKARASSTEKDNRNDLVEFMHKKVQEKMEKGSYCSFFSLVIDKDSCPQPLIPKSFQSVTFLDLNELEIARQITMEEYNIYAEIKPEEFQQLAWNTESLKHKAPNLLGMISRFNHISNAFATLIVQEERIKGRKKIIEKLIKIIEHLESMNSFNMQMAILSAFGQTPVHRLQHSFGALKPKILQAAQKYQSLFKSESSYKCYRERIAKVEPPAIPFIGVYLTDLTFVDQGNGETINGKINFRKKQLEYDVIIQVLRFQGTPYQFNLVPQIPTMIKKLKVISEDEMYDLSQKIEPRNSKKKDLK